MTLKQSFNKKLQENFRENVNLSNYSWFNLGGKAEYFFKAEDKKQLIYFLKEIKSHNLRTTIVGAGSNILFRDNGVKGAVIKLGKNFSYTKIIGKNIIEAGGATLDKKIADFAKNNNLGNLEFLSCIPGSIGGGIIMNSGCYENDISKVLLSIIAIDKSNLKEIEIKKEDINFSYRGTDLSKNLIITAVKLRGKVGIKEEIEKKQKYLINKKKTRPTKSNKNMWKYIQKY